MSELSSNFGQACQLWQSLPKSPIAVFRGTLTTNLGVRSSNLFGRANIFKHLARTPKVPGSLIRLGICASEKKLGSGHRGQLRLPPGMWDGRIALPRGRR